MTILNTVEHPYTTISILNWLLAVWESEGNIPLTIITSKHDGAPMNNRLRVRLSQLRKAVRESKDRDYKQFGFSSNVFSWTTESGEECDAVYVQRNVTRKHRMIESLSELGIGGRNGQN